MSARSFGSSRVNCFSSFIKIYRTEYLAFFSCWQRIKLFLFVLFNFHLRYNYVSWLLNPLSLISNKNKWQFLSLFPQTKFSNHLDLGIVILRTYKTLIGGILSFLYDRHVLFTEKTLEKDSEQKWQRRTLLVSKTPTRKFVQQSIRPRKEAVAHGFNVWEKAFTRTLSPTPILSLTHKYTHLCLFLLLPYHYITLNITE